MKRIIHVEALPNHRLRLGFEDGVHGIVDLAGEVGRGVFAAWADSQHFASVQMEPGARALVWPGDIDLCADALYLEITGLKPEDIFPSLRPTATHA